VLSVFPTRGQLPARGKREPKDNPRERPALTGSCSQGWHPAGGHHRSAHGVPGGGCRLVGLSRAAGRAGRSRQPALAEGKALPGGQAVPEQHFMGSAAPWPPCQPNSPLHHVPPLSPTPSLVPASSCSISLLSYAMSQLSRGSLRA